MKILGDYHTHTRYSCGNNENRLHAKGTIEENVKAAIAKGIKTIGISEHGFRHNFYGLSKENALKERAEIDRLNEKYPEINILMGVECNILDDKGRIDMDPDLIHIFDYMLAGYHYGSKPTSFKNLLHHADNLLTNGFFSKEYNTRSVINAMKKNNLLYISHPGDKGRIDIERVAKVAVETGTGLEINGYHDRLSADMIRQIKDMDVKFYIGSDAHAPDTVGRFDLAMQIVKEAGINEDRIENIEK